MKRALNSKRLLIVAGALAVFSIVLYRAILPRPRETIRVVTPPSIIASLPHWVAEDKGFYRDAGIDVKAVLVSNSALMAQAITSHDADVLPAVSLLDVLACQEAIDHPLLFSHSRMVSDPPFESILVPSGSALSTFKDLAGKRIAVYPGATATEAVRLFLQENGVDPKSVHFLQLPPPEHIVALEQGSVDASHLYDPHRTQALAGNLCRILVRSVYASLNEPSAMGTSALSSRFAVDNPQAARQYIRAWDRSIVFIREHREESRLILAQHLNLPPEIANAATWVDATTFSEMDRVTLARTIATVKKLGLLPPSVETDPTNYMYRQ